MEARRRALGRGLGALIPSMEEEPPAVPSADETTVRIDAIDANPYQPREHFADEALEELAASIREKGLLQPLLVRRVDGAVPTDRRRTAPAGGTAGRARTGAGDRIERRARRSRSSWR